ncbi:RING-H2 finger protein ATL46-like [Mercurialis annua]|uniref:RING-H2 finger protein ATL46-like n=1 Tax=Mercurialis annua TaxID=3986 RepID=UPI00215F5C44|nr:RING-H2 finger protein ATL46-like [Mercurialis annua]
MSRILYEINQKDSFFINPPPSNSTPSSSSFNKISPAILLVIIILAVIFFISGVVHLLVRCFMKRSHFSAIYHSNRYPETTRSQSLQRQLQQLFRQHDSGLDQAFIDALPVFHYKDIMGLREPFDCAVCLCEFSDKDRLRLLPTCSHAFHIDCIYTWLLSNSTCPLCRATLLSSGLNPLVNFDSLREVANGLSGDHGDGKEEEGEKKMVFSVRLGKFRGVNEGEVIIGSEEEIRRKLDGRRCYSMGRAEYVVGDSDLQVALSHDNVLCRGRTRRDSLSVSKIWLWSKNSRIPMGSSHLDMSSSSSSSIC